MLKVYKSEAVELSEEYFTVEAPPFEPDDFFASLSEEENGGEQEREGNCKQRQVGDEISMMLRKTEERAQQILEDAQGQAAVQAEAILQMAREQAAQEAEELRRKAYSEAYDHGIADGIEAKSRQVESLIGQLENAVVRIEGELSGFTAQYEGDLRWAVAEVAEKVLGRMVERDDMILLDMVKAAVDTVKNAEWIDVHLSDEAVYLIDRLEREMAPMKYLTVIPEELPPGTCIVDIPSGRIDASIHTQLNNLKEYFSRHGADL